MTLESAEDALHAVDVLLRELAIGTGDAATALACRVVADRLGATDRARALMIIKGSEAWAALLP